MTSMHVVGIWMGSGGDFEGVTALIEFDDIHHETSENIDTSNLIAAIDTAWGFDQIIELNRTHQEN